MYILPATSTEPAAFFSNTDYNTAQSTTQKWSSLVGVTTAIIGNILISFALNTQRYAHLRLSREREEDEEKHRQAQKGHSKNRSYGTQQSDIAEERAEVNAKAEPIPEEPELERGDGAGETQPLIPRLSNGDKKGAGSEEGEEDEDDEDWEAEQKSYLKSPIWWAGITMMTLGEAGNFLAYGFAPASIVSPLGVVALVSNCLIAPLLLHERFRWRDALGVVIAVGGCVVVVLSASDSNPKLGPNEIWNLITQWEFETYLGITILLIGVLIIASNKFGDRTILIDLGLVGLFGGYTALSTKGVASLLSNTIWRAVTFPITYLLVAVLVFTAVMQIKYVNRALQRFNATMVIPVQFVMFTISVIVGSAILYRDFERTSAADAGKFVGGCALTFLGVWCITSGRGGEGVDDDETALGEEEDAINLYDEEGQYPEIRERDDEDGRKPSIIASSSKSTPRLAPVPDENEDQMGTSYKSSYFTPQTHHPYDPQPLPPGTASAIHSASTSDLPADVPSELARRNLQPPPFHATTSAPIVPTTTDLPAARPHTPLKRGISHTEGSPTHSPVTPRRREQQSQQYLDPASAAAGGSERQRLISRHSVAGLLPAPYTSPLSSSLSAIVADSLRRPTPSSPLRRRSTKFRRKATGEIATTGTAAATPGAVGPKRHSIASGDLNFAEGDGEGQDPLKGRLRSLSATLVGSVKRRVTGGGAGARRESVAEEVEEGEGEAGPSRS